MHPRLLEGGVTLESIGGGNETTMLVIVVGDPFGEWRLIGPFDTFDESEVFVSSYTTCTIDWRIVEVEAVDLSMPSMDDSA
jgi:hypothetical protein